MSSLSFSASGYRKAAVAVSLALISCLLIAQPQNYPKPVDRFADIPALQKGVGASPSGLQQAKNKTIVIVLGKNFDKHIEVNDARVNYKPGPLLQMLGTVGMAAVVVANPAQAAAIPSFLEVGKPASVETIAAAKEALRSDRVIAAIRHSLGQNFKRVQFADSWQQATALDADVYGVMDLNFDFDLKMHGGILFGDGSFTNTHKMALSLAVAEPTGKLLADLKAEGSDAFKGQAMGSSEATALAEVRVMLGLRGKVLQQFDAELSKLNAVGK
jgi:hypothetical protein